MHDLAEQYTGDTPATAKWVSQPLKRALDGLEIDWHARNDLIMPHLTEREAKVLKEADMLDLCFKMVEEYRMGNKGALPILANGMAHIERNEPTTVTWGLLFQLKEYINEQG